MSWRPDPVAWYGRAGILIMLVIWIERFFQWAHLQWMAHKLRPLRRRLSDRDAGSHKL